MFNLWIHLSMAQHWECCQILFPFSLCNYGFPPLFFKKFTVFFNVEECSYSSPPPPLQFCSSSMFCLHICLDLFFFYLSLVEVMIILSFINNLSPVINHCLLSYWEPTLFFKYSQEELKQHIFHNCNLLLPVSYRANTSQLHLFRC